LKNFCPKRGLRGLYIGRDEEEMKEQQTLDGLLSRLSLHDQVGGELLRRGGLFKEWVEHLGVAHLSAFEQHCKVNGEKARLKKKLRRLALIYSYINSLCET
jgi:hypothetical protein